jgi:DNA-binding Lrp family transcriptional regulator
MREIIANIRIETKFVKYFICMDDIDGKILAELQENGRLTVTELADRVQLTPAPCHRRLRELERAGVITGYRAVVDPATVGLGFEAIVSVTLERGDAATVAAFEAAVAAVPQIRHAERLFGDPDYLLRVVAADLNDYAALRDQELATLPGILRITSTIVMKRIVDNRPLPQPRTRPRRTVKGVLSGDGRPGVSSRDRRLPEHVDCAIDQQTAWWIAQSTCCVAQAARTPRPARDRLAAAPTPNSTLSGR